MVANNRKFSLVVSLLVTTLLLTGCSKLSGEKNLSFYHYDMANKELYEELGEEYSKDNQYTIEVKAIPRETYLSTLKNDNELPDIFLVAEEDLLEILEDQKMSKRLSNLKRFSEKEEVDNFFFQVGRKKGWFGEKTLAIPYQYDIPVIYYNKDFFEQHSLEEPEYIEDFVNNSSVLIDNNIIPIGIRNKNKILDIEDLGQAVLLNSEDGSDLITEVGYLSTGFENLMGLSSEFKGKDLFKSDSPNSFHELLQGFVDEEYAMFSGGLEDMAYLNSKDINYGFFTMPGYLGKSRGIVKVSSLISISEKVKSTKEAEKFVTFLLEEENQEKLGIMIDGFTVNSMGKDQNMNPKAIYSFANELDLIPSLFQTSSYDERDIYLKEINKIFINEFTNIDEFSEELKNQLQ